MAVAGNNGTSAPKPLGDTNPRFTDAVCNAQFFHMDKFVIASHRNRLLLYRYKLPPAMTMDRNGAGSGAACDDIYLQKHRFGSYRLAAELENPGCVSVTDVAAHNAFISHVVITALSNRGVHLWDLAAGKVAASVDDAHTRPVHTLAVCPANASTPMTAPDGDGSGLCLDAHGACELFATSSSDSCIKLWDVRDVQKRVRCYAGGHINNCHRIGMQFSPCMRYLATCSEDRSVAVYDMRFGNACMSIVGQPASASASASASACATAAPQGVPPKAAQSASGSGAAMREVPTSVDMCYRQANRGLGGGCPALMMAAGGMDGQLRVFDQV